MICLNKKKKSKTKKIYRNKALQNTLKSKPSPIYSKDLISKITTGNLEDDLHRISEVDWIIEVVVEKIDIKKKYLKNRKTQKKRHNNFYKHIRNFY